MVQLKWMYYHNVNNLSITCVRQEVRAVERRVLLETLANKLPPGTISYSSKVKSVKAQEKEGTLLELEDGREILAKVNLSFRNMKLITQFS